MTGQCIKVNFNNLRETDCKIISQMIEDIRASQSAFTCSTLTIETLEQGVKNVQS